MRFGSRAFFILLAMGILGDVRAQQLKEFDYDINYDEARIPGYRLPPLLTAADGTRIETAEQWQQIRRPEILSLFANLIYGRIPTPETPLETTYNILNENNEFMDGRATKQVIAITFENEAGKKTMTIGVIYPNGTGGPVPAVMYITRDNPRSRSFEEHRDDDNLLRNGWPAGLMIKRGYGLFVANLSEIMQHNEVEFSNSIHRLFYPEGQSFPEAHEWGVLTAMGWGASRSLDYVETLDEIDHTRVALFGHSVNGKAALWAVARDQRFGMAVSAQSGCGGAALWRRKSGETLEKLVTRFPYWTCRNAWKFTGREAGLPIDQHMLLALIAPRPLYVFSAVEDRWADPRGEYLSAYHASDVYRLLGKTGLTSEASPAVRDAIIESDIGYHLREGGHSVELYDWERILEFMHYHWK